MKKIISYFRSIQLDRSQMYLTIVPFAFAKKSPNNSGTQTIDEALFDFPSTGIELMDEYHLDCMKIFNQGPFASRIVYRAKGDEL